MCVAIDRALQRVEYCFSFVNHSAYCVQNANDRNVFFNHMHSDQYAQFLYYFANELWNLTNSQEICDQLFCLNKALNNLFLPYKFRMPDIFLLSHPNGTIIGGGDEGIYSDFMVILQNVTISARRKVNGEIPTIGKGLFCSAGSIIIGNENIGNNVSIGANTTVYKMQIGDNKTVYTDREGKIQIKENKENRYAQKLFNVPIQ